jgi:hypothetical protein
MFVAKSTIALQRERFHTLGQPHGHVRSRLGATRRTAVFVGWTVSKQFVSILLLSSMHVFASLRVCRHHAARPTRHCRRRRWHHDFVGKQFVRLQFDNYSTELVPLLRLWRSRSGAGRPDAQIKFAQWAVSRRAPSRISSSPLRRPLYLCLNCSFAVVKFHRPRVRPRQRARQRRMPRLARRQIRRQIRRRIQLLSPRRIQRLTRRRIRRRLRLRDRLRLLVRRRQRLPQLFEIHNLCLCLCRRHSPLAMGRQTGTTVARSDESASSTETTMTTTTTTQGVVVEGSGDVDLTPLIAGVSAGACCCLILLVLLLLLLLQRRRRKARHIAVDVSISDSPSSAAFGTTPSRSEYGSPALAPLAPFAVLAPSRSDYGTAPSFGSGQTMPSIGTSHYMSASRATADGIVYSSAIARDVQYDTAFPEPKITYGQFPMNNYQ